MPERRLEGGSQTEVHERDGVVYRSPSPQSATVRALLQHLASVGFEHAPRHLGFADDGREMLAYVEGEPAGPWSDEALFALGAIVRRLHDATRSWPPPADATWWPSYLRHLPGDDRVIGHGDLGPWNVVQRDGMPVAIVDWDTASPMAAEWDLAMAAWLNVQLHDDDVAERWGLPDARGRARQLRTFVDGYGLDGGGRAGLVQRILEVAVLDSANEAIVGGVTPDSTEAVDAKGFPTMWAIAWRARSAAWIVRNRQVLEAALR